MIIKAVYDNIIFKLDDSINISINSKLHKCPYCEKDFYLRVWKSELIEHLMENHNNKIKLIRTLHKSYNYVIYDKKSYDISMKKLTKKLHINISMAGELNE